MLTANERDRLIAQWNKDRLAEEWHRARSEAYARAIQRAVGTFVRAIKSSMIRVKGSAASHSPEQPRPDAAAT
jgi:hypothetical protein